MRRVVLAFALTFGIGATCSNNDTDEPNRAPTANAGIDRTVAIGERVQLNGAKSMDPEGKPLIYDWRIAAKPEVSMAEIEGADSPRPTFTPETAGQFEIELTVSDGEFTSAPDTVVISAANRPPIANAGTDQREDLLNSTIQLDGTMSRDPDMQTITYSWRFVTRPAGSNAMLAHENTAQPTFVNDAVGTYQVELVVNDGEADSAPDSVDVVSSDGNTPPTAVVAANPGIFVSVNTMVQLDASGSTDPDGQTLTYAWTMSSKPGGSAAMFSDTTAVNPTFTADLAGDYDITLAVNDGIDTVRANVRISASTGPAGMIEIQTGTYTAGSPMTETGRMAGETQRSVTISRGFYLSPTEVTQAEWHRVMGNNPSGYPACGGSCPQDNVSFIDAAEFANRRSAAEGLPQCYMGTRADFMGIDCLGYRMPTEDEWEYAARAGTTSANYLGEATHPGLGGCEVDALTGRLGWYCGNSVIRTGDPPVSHTVALKEANAWGLYDMLGNLWEWTSPEPGMVSRNIRGGSHRDAPYFLRAAQFLTLSAGQANTDIGFRLARTKP